MFGANRAPILHQHLHCLQTYRKRIPHDPCHLGDPSGASKIISEPVVCSAQTVPLSCVKISTISKRSESSFHLSLVTRLYQRACPKWFLKQWHVWRKLWTYLVPTQTLSPNDQNEILPNPHHIVVTSGVSNTIFEPMERSVQTMHLSCSKITTISERTESSFHLRLVT
jgi:hypothetical protein